LNERRGQLKQGRIDVAVQGSETIPYAMSSEPGAYRARRPFRDRLSGDRLPQGRVGAARRRRETLRGLMTDGTYKAILDKYKLAGNAVDDVTIDGARP